LLVIPHSGQLISPSSLLLCCCCFLDIGLVRHYTQHRNLLQLEWKELGCRYSTDQGPKVVLKVRGSTQHMRKARRAAGGAQECGSNKGTRAKVDATGI
jgi:hypothetical protein